jgi:hypothetical protein
MNASNTNSLVNYLRGSVPEGWIVQDPWEDWAQPSFEAPIRDMTHITIIASGNNRVDLVVLDTETHLEVHSIDVFKKGGGVGTKTFLLLKDYVDSQGKGLLGTEVKNQPFVESLGFMTKRPIIVDGEDISEYAKPEYVYGNVPVDAVDYSWMV